MRIESARLLEIALPLREPFELSGGRMDVRRSLIVELKGADGQVGLGESAPFELPFYSGETVASARHMLARVLLPRVLEYPVTHPEELSALLEDGVRGNAFARAGVETAWWHLAARSGNTTVAGMVTNRLLELGVAADLRATGERVTCGVALGIPEGMQGRALEHEVHQAVSAGYQRIKLKVKPGWTVEPVRITRAVLQQFGRALPVWVDGNGAFDPTTDGDELTALRDEQVAFVEQPFPADSLFDSYAFERESGVRVCLDESLTSDRIARQVVELGGPMIWNLKVQRLGGLNETCKVYARGVAAGAEMWVGTMPESGLGAQAALAVATLEGIRLPTDVEPSDRWYAPGTDVVPLTMESDGTMLRRDDVDADLSAAAEVWASYA